MDVVPRVEKLACFLDYLDGLTARATVAELRARLRSLDIGVEDVSDYARFAEDGYLRNLIREGPWYHLLVICWRSGQRSPIHNHASSTCGLRVLTGIATETVFATTPSSQIKAVCSTEMAAGDVAVMKDADIHQVSNLQAQGTDLVTVHVYSPPLLRMGTYTLMDGTVGEFRPQILEHSFGSGI